MSARLYLDRSPGETRGVLTRGGRPERFLVEREGEAATLPLPGARYAGRALAVSPRMGLARIDIGAEQPGALKLTGARSLGEGALIEVEVTGAPARGKGALLKVLGPAPSSRPGLLSPAPGVAERLAAFAPGVPLLEGEEARNQAAAAEGQALAQAHRLSGGVSLTIQPTRGLVAVDVDLEAQGQPASAARANLLAVREAARLLRLKALSGLVIVDLVGFVKEAGAIRAEAKAAFAPDGAEVVIGPVSRFGVLELSKPRGEPPVHERLLDAEGRPTPRTLAQRIVRAMQRQGRFEPGRIVVAGCSPPVAAALRPLAGALGPLFQVRETVGAGDDAYDISAR